MSHVTQDHYRSQNAGGGRSVIKPEDAITTEGWSNGNMYFGNCTYNKVDDNIAVNASSLYIDVQSLTNNSKQSIQVQLEVVFTSAASNTLKCVTNTPITLAPGYSQNCTFRFSDPYYWEFSNALLNEALNRYVEITWYGTAVLTDITNNIKHYVYFSDGDIEEVNYIQCAY